MNPLLLLSSEFSRHLIITFAHCLWQGMAIAAVATVAARLLRRRDARWRYGVHLAALVSVTACLPVTYLAVIQTPGVHAQSEPSMQHAGMTHNAGPSIADSALVESLSAGGSESNSTRGTNNLHSAFDIFPDGVRSLRMYQWAGWLSAIYLLGLLVMLVRLAVSLAGAQRLCRNTVAVDSSVILDRLDGLVRELRLRAAPAVAWSQSVVTPTVVGIVRPTILLPISLATTLSPDEISAILAHELAHIRRYDLWVNLFQRFVEALLFFHPAVWYLSRRLSTEREYCCDDIASSRGLGSAAYAELLLRLAENRSRTPSAANPQVALAATGRRSSQLRRRVARLFGLEEELTMRMTRRGTLSLVAVLVAAGLILSASLPAETEPRIAANESQAPSAADRDKPAAVVDEDESDDRPAIPELSEMEGKLLGTWGRGSFLVYWTVTFRPNRTYRYQTVTPDGEPLEGRWRVENGTQLVYETPQAETVLTTRYQIVAIDEDELKLQSTSPARPAKTYTYTRTAANESQPDKTQAQHESIPIGKIVERTVHDDDPKLGDFCIDFETGRLFSIPAEYRQGSERPPALFKNWIVPNGIDAMGETKSSVRGLMGLDMVVIPISGPADGLPEISEARLSSQFVDTVPGRPVPISGKGDLPATYLFETREGTRGVMQIVDFANNPRGVKIRYKLLAKKNR